MNRTPLRTSTTSYGVNDSPSITMERGAYRLRAPYPKIPLKTTHPALAKRYRPPDRRSSSNLALLLVLFTFASISSFGIAYYIYSTRWDARKLRRQKTADQYAQDVLPNPPTRGDDSIVTSFELDEKFLAYLPHSGFHNQRIAFENALVLARLLNRTLLMPPIYLGDKRLRYASFDVLYRELALLDKVGLQHCSRCPLHLSLPLECMDFFKHTRISWEWLIDLTRIKAGQRLRQRWNLTEAWIYEHLSLSKADTLFIKDTSPYHYRFLDTPTDVSPPQHKFMESLYISDLSKATERLLHIGTLFGSSRLRLKNPASITIREVIRDSMSFSNPSLLRSRDLITNSLGPSYIGVHLRLGDGEFMRNAEINTHQAWWQLAHEVLGYSQDEVTALAHAFEGDKLDTSRMPISPREDHRQVTSDTEVQARERYLPPGRYCRGRLHIHSHLLRLNTPIFISTDVGNSPLLFEFYRTFPCIFYLSDFPDAVSLLDGLHNTMDGVGLKPFLFPFLDALVVGRSKRVIGTANSTFSRFAIDVLWRKDHNLTIVHRGG